MLGIVVHRMLAAAALACVLLGAPRVSAGQDNHVPGEELGLVGQEMDWAGDGAPFISRWKQEDRRGLGLLGEARVAGRRIKLNPWQGKAIRGRVERLESLPDSSYARLLAEWRGRRPGADSWPEPGEPMRVEHSRWWNSSHWVQEESGRFVGLRGYLLLLEENGSVRAVPLHAKRVRIQGEHGALDLTWLVEAEPRQWPPSRERLVLRTRRGAVEVDLDDLRRLDLNRPWELARRTGWWLGGVGLVVAGLASSISIDMNDSGGWDTPDGNR